MRNFQPIVAMLEHAWGNICATDGYHKQPKIVLQSEHGNVVTLKYVTRGNSKGTVNIYVQLKGEDESTYFGKMVGGQTSGIRQWGSMSKAHVGVSKALIALLDSFAADPAAISAEMGRNTGSCCFCNRVLTCAESRSVGYGPICAGRYGLAWGHTPAGFDSPTIVHGTRESYLDSVGCRTEWSRKEWYELQFEDDPDENCVADGRRHETGTY